MCCLSLSPPFPEKPSLLADIGQCAGPIRLRRTLAADFSLAASLGWRPRLPSISAKRFFRGESRRGHLYQSDAAPSRSRRSVSARGGGWRRIPGDLRPAPVRSVLPPGTPLRPRTSPRPASAIRRPVASAVAPLASSSPLPSVRKLGEVSILPFTRHGIHPQNENKTHLRKVRRRMQSPATRNTFGQNGMVEARRKSAGGGAEAADGERSPRRGAFPGARPSRVGAGRRSPGMRRQPLPQADTKRMTTRRGHVAWQRELDVFTRQKNARPRLREGGRTT